MGPYLPEGRLLNTRKNLAACATPTALRRAQESGQILEGMALAATQEHDLLVRCGPFWGRIPRQEGALGIREDTVRDIAILSRVGRPVCFTVIGWEEDTALPRPILSRRQVQQRARQWLEERSPGTILPATVTRLERFGAFVDVGCGISSMIPLQRVSVSRIPHPGERFVPGQEIWTALLGRDDTRGHLLITHRELLGTWEQNAALFTQGMTVPGVVRGVHDYGAFVELTANLSGLAECRVCPAVGERVSVLIRSIQPQSQKIKLSLIDRLPPAPPAPLRYFLPPEGRLERWRYAPADSVKGSAEETVFSPETPCAPPQNSL